MSDKLMRKVKIEKALLSFCSILVVEYFDLAPESTVGKRQPKMYLLALK